MNAGVLAYIYGVYNSVRAAIMDLGLLILVG